MDNKHKGTLQPDENNMITAQIDADFVLILQKYDELSPEHQKFIDTCIELLYKMTV